MNGYEMQNPFASAKLIGFDIDAETYLRQEPGIERGNPGFVASRGMLRSASECWSEWLAGTEHKDTEATEWGNLMDTRFLMPGEFQKRYAIEPATYPATKTSTAVKNGECGVGDPIPWNNTATFCKDWTKDAKSSGRLIISADEKSDSDKAMEALGQDSRIVELMRDAKVQAYLVGEYKDRATALTIPVKCLIDIVPGGRFADSLADFKTGRNILAGPWGKVCDESWYDAQGALELWLWNKATGEDRSCFYHAIQRNVAPWQTGRRMLSAECLGEGRRKIINALENYCQCLASGIWPDHDELAEFGPGGGWSIVDPPQYALTRIATRLELVKSEESHEEANPRPLEVFS